MHSRLASAHSGISWEVNMIVMMECELEGPCLWKFLNSCHGNG